MNIEYLYKSNNPPLPSEEVDIRARIAEWNLEISAIDAEMEKLERRRCQIEEKKKMHVEVLSALRKFPSELIGEIFRKMIHSEYPEYPGQYELKRLAPLGRVSRRWNRILYSTPRLCTDLCLWVPDDGNLDDLVPTLQWWMELSRNTPLSLAGLSRVPLKETSRFIFIILNNKSVWKELHLPFPRAEGFISCVSATESRWDALEALSLGSYNSMLSQNGERPIHMGQFPRLKSLVLRYKEIILPHHFDLPWSNLTDLTLELDNNVEQYICIIQHCPDLESLRLTVYNMDPIPTTPLPSVVLSKLQQLIVKLKTASGFRLFHSIQCPALTNLQITSPHRIHDDDSNALRAFFSKTTKLTKLRLDAYLDDSELVYLLKETPSLADLRIRSGSLNGEFVMPHGYLTPLHTLDTKCPLVERSRQKFHDFVRSEQAESTTYTRLEHWSLVNIS